jgi:hypothetical protein
MSENVREWFWNTKRTRAAELLAQDELSDDEIAETVGATSRQFRRWKKREEFAARIEELREQFDIAVQRHAVAKRLRRVKALNDRWMRMQKVIEERAADPAMQEVPGGKTGLLVHDVKVVGGGDNVRVVDLYQVDTGLLKELREHERQAAQELGQWVEKKDLTYKGKQITFIDANCSGDKAEDDDHIHPTATIS